MKGYKILLPDMHCHIDGVIYRQKKWYDAEESPAWDERGFSFFKELHQVTHSGCPITAANIFEVDTGEGSVSYDDYSKRHFSTKICLVREVPRKEVIQYFEDHKEELIAFGDYSVKFAMIDLEIGLDSLLKSPEAAVRTHLASRKHFLGELVNDPEWGVRLVVADKGYGLDILVNDPNRYVRQMAEQRLKQLKES